MTKDQIRSAAERRAQGPPANSIQDELQRLEDLYEEGEAWLVEYHSGTMEETANNEEGAKQMWLEVTALRRAIYLVKQAWNLRN